MKKSYFYPAAVLLFLAMPVLLSSAEETQTPSSAEQCTSEINSAFARERFIFQSVLFGLKKAEKEPVGATRVDEKGQLLLKVSDGHWVNGTDSYSDDEMDDHTVKDALAQPLPDQSDSDKTHPGLLEAQRAMTSDIIPPLLQSFRAYECRTAAVCEMARRSLNVTASDPDTSDNTGETETIKIPGCVDQELTPFTSCEPNPLFTLTDVATLKAYCEPMLTKLLNYDEGQILYLTHYDAAHRSLRQFAGYLEPFLRLVHFPIQTPVRQASDFLRTWSRVPCFEPHCSDTQPSCHVTIECNDSCPDGDLAHTEPMRDGEVKICVSNSVNALIMLDHEIVHAKQYCKMGNDKEAGTAGQCCDMEREANMTTCQHLISNGEMEGYSAEDCATAGANNSCTRFGNDVCGYAPDELKGMIVDAGNNQEPGTSCSDVKDRIEAEINAEIGNPP